MSMITIGDRVKVVGVSGVGGASFDVGLIYKSGVVVAVDYRGLCEVEFEDGTIAKLWRGTELAKNKTKTRSVCCEG